jgi:hypothetical protein
MTYSKFNHKLLLLLLGLFLGQSLDAQLYDKRRSRWTLYKHQVGASIGFTGFLGDLGGADAIGSDGLSDLNFNQNRITFNLEYRYFIKRNLSARGSFLFAFLSGDDANTQEPFRRNRNLHFRAPVFELTGMIELFVLREEPGKLSPFNSKRFMIDLYVFVGFGVSYFNPQAKYEGTWTNLQPLGTEGQGIELQPDNYSRITPVIPIGIGLAKKFKGYWSAGLEVSYRKTFSDYIDDVSTVYFNNDKIRTQYGDAAAYLADPSLGYIEDENGTQIPVNSTSEGMQRGDPNDKDAYLTAVITIHYYLAGRKKVNRSRF